MHSHNDELNRYLDALVLGTPGGSFDLDRETVEIASRFTPPSLALRAPDGFISQLENTLMHRAEMRPVAIGGPIEDIGEGIGLVAARPQPMRVRFSRIAALAAVVLLMLAAAGFYRLDSDNGKNWLLAPVASASPPIEADECKTWAAFDATTVGDLIREYQPSILWGVRRDMPGAPGRFIHILPESSLPSGTNAGTEAVSAIEKDLERAPICWQWLAEVGGTLSDFSLLSATQLDDGRIATRINARLNGIPIGIYVDFVRMNTSWLPLEIALYMPDDVLAAASHLRSQSSWSTQVYEIDSGDGQQSNFSVWEMRVPAGEPVDITVKNIGTVSERFTISDLGTPVDEMIAPGDSKKVTATFTPGWHVYQTAGEGDTYGGQAVGYIYAEDTSASTPVAEIDSNLTSADCPTGAEFMATVEANDLPNFYGLSIPATMNIDESMDQGEFYNAPVYVQPAPNDPSTRIQTIALSAIPKGDPASPEITASIAERLPFDLYCFAPRQASLSIFPTSFTQMTVLSDGNVGVLLGSDPGGFGAQLYVVYARGSREWLVSAMVFALPDADFVAPSNLPIETSTLVQAWNAVQDGVDTTSTWPDAVQVAAGINVTITAENLGSVPVTFSIPGTTVSARLEVGESRAFVVNLSAGVYSYNFSGVSDDSAVDHGFIFVTDVPAPEATPTS